MGMNYIVYCHTNKINGKKYIGITSRKNINARWKNGNGYKNNQVFYRAIQKYGWDGFEHEILFKNLTKDEACENEIELIREMNTCVNNPKSKGYNISIGGGIVIMDDTKKIVQLNRHDNDIVKIWDSLYFASRELETFPNTIRKCCESKEKTKTTCGYRWAYKDDYDNNIISKILPKNRPDHNTECVIQVSNENINIVKKWKNIFEVKETLNMSRKEINSVIRCCNGNQKTFNKNIWYWESIYKDSVIEPIINIRSFKIIQIKPPEMIPIKIWNNANEIEKELNISTKNLSACCLNKRKTAGGYVWMYEKEYIKKGIDKSKLGEKYHTGTPIKVCQKSVDKKEIIMVFNSAQEAMRITNINKTSIGLCCKKRQKTAGGFIWEYYLGKWDGAD